MDEFLLQLVLAIGEIFLEALLQFASEILIDVVLRAVASASDLNPVFNVVGYAILGALMGGASLFEFPHPLIHPSRFHGISLLISPLLTGLVMSLVGAFLERRDQPATPIESFRRGFSFAFGMALTRLLFVK